MRLARCYTKADIGACPSDPFIAVAFTSGFGAAPDASASSHWQKVRNSGDATAKRPLTVTLVASKRNLNQRNFVIGRCWFGCFASSARYPSGLLVVSSANCSGQIIAKSTAECLLSQDSQPCILPTPYRAQSWGGDQGSGLILQSSSASLSTTSRAPKNGPTLAPYRAIG